jgi:hypothetical protein
MIMEKVYLTKMSVGKMVGPNTKVTEGRHTTSEIISHAEETLAKVLDQDLAEYAGLEEVCTRRVGEDTVWGYVDTSGKHVEFTEDLKLKAAIAVFNVNGHFFEATPINQ